MCGRWSWVAMRSMSQRGRYGLKGTVIIHIVDWIDNIIFVSWDDDDLHHQTIMIACTHQINLPTACNLSLFRRTPVLTSIIGLTTIATISNFLLIQINLPCGSLTHTHTHLTSLSVTHNLFKIHDMFDVNTKCFSSHFLQFCMNYDSLKKNFRQ